MSSTIKSSTAIPQDILTKEKNELGDTNDRFQTCSLKVSKNLESHRAQLARRRLGAGFLVILPTVQAILRVENAELQPHSRKATLKAEVKDHCWNSQFTACKPF